MDDALEEMKKALTALLENDEIFSLTASVAMKSHKAYLEVGFNHDDAIALVAAGSKR